ncbi:hypothetical protein SNOG_13750 [Parastagonospora nodorum SN15]|uniref:Peptidase C45 hydrolase domain-containing protein n=1 Tax=Phaeosphaeria nodorum (strain SN15 / ATCC MYA-4574 / FGSC 10173) TaxID=321614 RepID=Q0U3B4_PHANO|nr:hypothetical protein SNOG_13750 [Parastagonospora nodorum SN15]EAT78774.1 hypothetical protein SNOG_13750 [Parastagonospora nodorum SN15]
MLFVECKGTPFEFYAGLFLKNCKKTWPEVQQRRIDFRATSKGQMARLPRGNARHSPTALKENFWISSPSTSARRLISACSVTGNWDWMTQQKENIIITKITQTDKPTIIQVTEAGIIGKIGFNDAGVGTLLNAIKVQGVNSARMPVHFGLRMALESASVDEAVGRLERYGMASSAHILLADPHKSLGLEFTKSTFAHCMPDSGGRVVHTNHLLLDHPSEKDTVWINDSLSRAQTMGENAGRLGSGAAWEEVGGLFEDEQNAPGAICRTETEVTGSATLFNIVMDLKAKRAVVRLGRPTEVEERVELEL